MKLLGNFCLILSSSKVFSLTISACFNDSVEKREAFILNTFDTIFEVFLICFIKISSFQY